MFIRARREQIGFEEEQRRKKVGSQILEQRVHSKKGSSIKTRKNTQDPLWVYRSISKSKKIEKDYGGRLGKIPEPKISNRRGKKNSCEGVEWEHRTYHRREDSKRSGKTDKGFARNSRPCKGEGERRTDRDRTQIHRKPQTAKPDGEK